VVETPNTLSPKNATATAFGMWGAPDASAGSIPGAPACPVFPADNVWNRDISTLPVHPQSATWMAKANPSRNLHPDLGTAQQGYGMPINVVENSHSTVTVSFMYADESDNVPYPFGPDTRLESPSDSHALMINRDSCVLYEIWQANWNNGNPTGGSGAVWHLNSDALRPDGWTSADAAGLPITPGLLRLDEVNALTINHPVRFTLSHTQKAHVWPARHDAGTNYGAGYPPFGTRFRLKSSYSNPALSPQAQAVVHAMQHYGLFLADIGSDWYFQGTQDNWPDSLVSEMKTIPASQFEAVDESSLMIDPGSGQARQPATASAPNASSPSKSAPPPAVSHPASSPAVQSAVPAAAPNASAVPSANQPSSPSPLAPASPGSLALATSAGALGPSSGTAQTTSASTRSAGTSFLSHWQVLALIIFLVVCGGVLATVWVRKRAADRP